VNSRSQEVWGLRYIDDAMVRLLDKNLDGDCRDSGELFWQLNDAQFSTVAVIDKNAVLQERVSYTSYGVGTHRWPHEVNNTGGVTTSGSTSDYGVINTLATANSGAGTPIDDPYGNYNVAADLNRDGVIDSGDMSLFTAMGGAKSALASGLISDPSGPDNVFGYDGYVYNPDQGLYTVRFRWYNPTYGRWLQRDPAGYVGGAVLYEYGNNTPINASDHTGLLSELSSDGCTSTCSESPDCQEAKRLFEKVGNINRSIISACGEDDPTAKAILANATDFAKIVGQFGSDVTSEFLDKKLARSFFVLGLRMIRADSGGSEVAAGKNLLLKAGVSKVAGKCLAVVGPAMDVKKMADGYNDKDVLLIISGASGIVITILPGGKFVQLGAGLFEAGIDTYWDMRKARAYAQQDRERCKYSKDALRIYERRFEDALGKCGYLPVEQKNMRRASE